MNVICMFFYEKGYKKCNKKCVLVYGWDGYLSVFILIKVFSYFFIVEVNMIWLYYLVKGIKYFKNIV